VIGNLTPDQLEIREAILKLCAQFGDEYWLQCDEKHEFPQRFYDAMAQSGWLGIAMPESAGGAGLGITEAAVMMQAVAESGAGMTGASAIHLPIFGLQPVVLFGTEEQQQRMIPSVIAGETKMCFAVTEPNTGLDTTSLKTRAVKTDGGYLITGEKIWITQAHLADRMLIIARTTPLEEVKRKTEGLSLFYAKIDRTKMETRIIPKMGRHGVGSNMVFINDLFVAEEDRIGAEGQGFKILIHGLNPERILMASEATGLGRVAIQRAARFARERVVFGRPIGQNQGIQHPLAKAWMQVEAAALMAFTAAAKFDRGEDCGIEANSAKYLSAEAGFEACQTAMMSMGGMGYAKEYHIERYLREVMIPRIAPVSPHMIMNYIAEQVLELPKSY
jgi:acyl-CoA dehydrogenase